MDKMKVSQKIAELRARNGLTAKELGDKIEKSETTILNYGKTQRVQRESAAVPGKTYQEKRKKGEYSMSNISRLTPEQIEALAKEVREYLLDNGMWQDVNIYFNGKRFTTRDRETGKYQDAYV